jgi:hypothetical protein
VSTDVQIRHGADLKTDIRPRHDGHVDAVRVDGPRTAIGVRPDVDARPHAGQLQAHDLVHVVTAKQLHTCHQH